MLQPFLYELPQDVGDYKKGTVLLSSNAIPAGFESTNIQLYASEDKGSVQSIHDRIATKTDRYKPLVGVCIRRRDWRATKYHQRSSMRLGTFHPSPRRSSRDLLF